jgi:hypothetical protein
MSVKLQVGPVPALDNRAAWRFTHEAISQVADG